MTSKQDFLAAFVGDALMARTLRVFALHPTEQFTRAEIARRAGVLGASVARGLKRLEKMNVLNKRTISIRATRDKNKRIEDVWIFNQSFTHAYALSSFVREVSPPPHDVVLDALKRSGTLSLVVLSGTFVDNEARPLDILVAAASPNEKGIERAVRTLEGLFGRELRYAAFALPELRYRMTIQDRLLRDIFDFPHTVLLDRTKLL
jgi:hypothetical protein